MRMSRHPAASLLGAAVLTLLAAGWFVADSAADEWINMRLNQDETSELQNEEQIAINPTDPDNRVAVWRDFRLGYRQVGWAYTFDGGRTWTEGGLFEEPHYPWQSDPGVTADADGNFYAIVLSYVSTSQENGFYVFKSTDGGVSWGPPLEVIDQYPDVFEDKELIACDRTDCLHAGNLYVAWTRFGWTTTIELRRSTDSGESWDETVRVSDQSGVQFPIPVVGRDGQVYVAWTSYSYSDIRIDRSDDGGETFGSDRAVVDVYTPSTVLDGGVDAYSSPHMDADITDGPYSGRLYLSFMDRRAGLPDRDIWVTWSDDQGVSWSEPVRINDDAPGNHRDQFHPWLAVDNQGVVSVVFLDRRHDPQNLTYHCVLTQSFDGGATWTPNVQVSTAPSDPSYAAAGAGPPQTAPQISRAGSPPHATPQISLSRAGLLGEYIGLTGWNGRVTPVWTDIRNFHQDVYAGYFESFSGVAPAEGTHAMGALRIVPNPLRAGQPWRILCGQRSVAEGAGGVLDAIEGARTQLRWQDAAGRRCASGGRLTSGVYFLELKRGVARSSMRLVVLE
ncbi:MAG: hypothetical protein GF330_01240 [Candidatus Eisenbacteria bacterium]|nr:hypothetical protein [Candidatus Eisenbacteria bacterium]